MQQLEQTERAGNLNHMCGSIKYTDLQNKAWTVYFPSPKAALPTIKKNGEIEWVAWGRRNEEDAPNFPNSGWARLDSIKAAKSHQFNHSVLNSYPNKLQKFCSI